MTVFRNQGAAVTEPVLTTNNSWTELFRYDLSDPMNGNPGGGYGMILVYCRNPSNNASAFWNQPIGAKFSSGTTTTIGGLPDLLVSTKELSLILTDMRVQFDGSDIVISGKGISSTTLKWTAAINFDLLQSDN